MYIKGKGATVAPAPLFVEKKNNVGSEKDFPH